MRDSSATTNQPDVQPVAKTNGRLKQNEEVFGHLQNRILTHWPQARQILRGEMPAPRTAIVYPTYVCNQDCLWCEYSPENTDPGIKRLMPADDFRQLMVDLRDLGVEAVEFCGGGEPTMHPLFTEMVLWLKENKMSVGLLTNGTRLRGEMASALVDCASYVRVGFDGATAETVDKVKRPRTPEARFDAVCKNIRELVELRDARGTGVRISIKVVLDQNNFHEIEKAVQLADELGVDSIQFKAARLVASELTQEQSVHVDHELAAVRQKYPRMIVVGGTKKINMTTQCWLTPLQLTVDPLGEVFLCCYYRHRKEAHSIGNCFAEPLEKLWYSDKHWEAIRGIQPCECNNLDCRFVEYNKILDAVMVDDDAQFEFI